MSFIMRPIRFASTGHIIEGSGLFGGDDDYLTYAVGSASSSRRIFTIECLFKRSSISNNIMLFSSDSSDLTYGFMITIHNTNDIRIFFNGSVSGHVSPTALLRDTSSYYHLVVAVDTTQATAANRCKVYMNGVLMDIDTGTYPPLNFDTAWGHSSTVHTIGYSQNDAASDDCDVYMARCCGIDGQALAPTDFGEVTDDGFWQINDASGLTFGTNGFLIEGGVNVAAGTDSNGTNQPGATPNLLIHSNTTNDSTTAVNSGADGSAVTMNGNTKHVTAQKVFGTSSILFPGSSGDYVSIPDTAATEMGARDFTIECRVRLDAVDSYQRFVSKYNTATSKRTWSLSFSNDGSLIFQVTGSGGTVSISESWSPSADTWYALRVTRGGGKIQLYVDGTRLGSGTANTTTVVDNDTPIELGSRNLGTTDLFAGHMDEIMVLMGTALTTASSYTVPTTAYDTGNSFLKTGTITTTNDSPTNDADDGYGNYATFNPLIPDTNAGTPVYTDGNRHFANASGTGYCGASTLAINSGKFYVEIKPNTFVNDEEIIGFALASSNVWGSTFQLGYTSGQGAGLHTLSTSDTKLKIDGGSLTTVDTKMLSPDRTIIAIDSEAGKGWLGFYDNSGSVSRWVDTSGTTRTTDQPAAGTNATWTFTANEAVLVGSSLYGDGNTDIYADSGDWLGTPPSGFVSMGTQNLPTPAPINYEDEYYIEAGISHSNGSTTAVTLPKTVSGGAMVRIKRTDSTGSWYGFDTVRGANKSVRWDVTEAESTSTFDDQNLTGTTFTMPSDLATGTYLLECFYVGSYFQIKGFVGDHPTVQTLSYDSALDSAPGFMVFFNRDGSTQERTMTYHISTGNASRLDVTDHATAASNAGAFGSFTPTTTQFKVGNEQNSNQDSANIISYHWANSGPYAFGSYTGNGNTDGPVSNVGGGSQFLFRKNSGAATFWSTTSPQLNGNEVNSALDLSGTQALTADAVSQMDFLSTGFKTRDNGSEVHLNNSGATYIYGAFGIQPLTDGAINQGRAK